MAEYRSVVTSNVHNTLAVVRCGDASLHYSWSGEGRRFDIGISYFGDDAEKTFPEARFVHRCKGGKWDGLYSFFGQFPDCVKEYEYFWFPDDDIAADVEAVNRLIEIREEHKLVVCQPSLDDHSYWSHLITLRHPRFILRHTNFVEIMVPLISRAILQRTLPMIENTRSGFGMDFVWPKMAADITGGVLSSAIVDSVCVRHTRPVGGSLHKMMQKIDGHSVLDEMRIALEGVDHTRGAVINGITVPRIRILSGLDRTGKYRRGLNLVWAVAADLLAANANNVQSIRRMAAIRHALKTLA
jgi:hypothetical protein